VLSGIVSFACSSSSEPTGSKANELPDSSGDASAEGIAESVTLLEDARITSASGDRSFQRVTADVAVTGPFTSVNLVVDLSSTCFPFTKWQSEPPPAGQNWPASCDAFDRNFEITLLDPASPTTPAIELVHAITPFGGPLHVEEDVTDVFNALSGPRTLEVVIPTWSDASGKVSGSAGGWNVSARLEVVHGPAPRDVIAVIPLHHGSLTTPDANKTFPFTLPPGTTKARIEYTATGHGGGAADDACIGPAEEFCRRKHVLSLDGAVLETLDPWRTDCKTLCTLVDGGPFGNKYCKENPCGAIGSVRAPRANWCPGSVTPAKSFEPPTLTSPGPHTLGLAIDKIADQGSWLVSAKVFAYR
jgi:hypothetical protein